MKQAVIDIGSNSVRLMMWEDGKTLSKEIETTRLGEGTAETGMLSDEAMERTAAAVNAFKISADLRGAVSVSAFASEAVRSAPNRQVFTDMVKKMCGLGVDVLTGEREALYGAAGALEGSSRGAVIDVGGASSEATVIENGHAVFAVSVPLGAVRLRDISGGEREKSVETVTEYLRSVDFPDCRGTGVTAIGGTATSLAAVHHGLDPYDPTVTDGTVLSIKWIEDFAEKAFAADTEEIKAIKGMDPRRADIIAGGALLLSRIAQALNTDSVTVSESDNMEGYILSGSAK